MADFITNITSTTDIPEDQQRKAGQPVAGIMPEEFTAFCKTITSLIDSGEIDVVKPETFLNQAIYDSLDEQWKAKTDLALVNIASLLTHIADFYKSKETPDSSPQLQNMIEQLWQMKDRLESQSKADIFKF